MISLRHLLRASRWARNPPSARRVRLVVIVVILSLILVGVERFIGWPDVLTLDPRPRLR